MTQNAHRSRSSICSRWCVARKLYVRAMSVLPTYCRYTDRGCWRCWSPRPIAPCSVKTCRPSGSLLPEATDRFPGLHLPELPTIFRIVEAADRSCPDWNPKPSQHRACFRPKRKRQRRVLLSGLWPARLLRLSAWHCLRYERQCSSIWRLCVFLHRQIGWRPA